MITKTLRVRLAVAAVTASTLTLGLASCTAANSSPVLEIRADSDRNGIVDASDSQAETAALVLPNIGVSDVDCPTSDSAASDNELEACHDAMDDIAHAPENLAAVQIPAFDVSPDAVATLEVEGDPLGNIRVFKKQGDGWAFLASGAELDAESLQAGVTLGVDSRDVIRDATEWDGSFTLSVTVDDAGAVSQASVDLSVAPLLLHNHTEAVSTLYTSKSGDREAHQQFVQNLSDALETSTVKNPLEIFTTDDNWSQDIVEFGYASIPAADGETRSIEIAVRSPQPDRIGGRAVFDLRTKNFGAVQTGGDEYRQVDSFGNLEVIPPYEHDGVSYPAGRIIYGNGGKNANFHEDARTFFSSQQLQDPLELDTSWLAIAHVDEFVQFLPADNGRGWTIAVADPEAGLQLLRAAQAAGNGSTPAGSHELESDITINELLADEDFLSANATARDAIEANLETLLAETGVAMDEVIRLPHLYDVHGWTPPAINGPDTDGSSDGETSPLADAPFDAATASDGEIIYAPGTIGAYVPGAVNGIVISDTEYFSPKQWGPVIDGVDIFETALDEAYSSVGLQVTYIDDYETHHVMAGEIHCGTNAVRTVTTSWWQN